MRTVIHVIPVAVLANVLGPIIAERPLGERLNQYINAGGYIPFSVGLAAGLNNDRLIAVLLAALLVINNYPDNLLQNATAALSGLALGAGLRTLILEHK